MQLAEEKEESRQPANEPAPIKRPAPAPAETLGAKAGEERVLITVLPLPPAETDPNAAPAEPASEVEAPPSDKDP